MNSCYPRAMHWDHEFNSESTSWPQGLNSDWDLTNDIYLLPSLAGPWAWANSLVLRIHTFFYVEKYREIKQLYISSYKEWEHNFFIYLW